MAWDVACLCGGGVQLVNTVLVKRLPIIEAVVLVIHVVGFVVVLAVLWATGPIGDAKETFTTFNDFGGWNDNGLATLSGIVAVMLSLLGADAAVHMAEEVRDAGNIIPRSMIFTTLVDGSMGFVMLVTFCSVLGSIDEALASPTRQPYLFVFYNSTGSVGGASAMRAIVILIATFCSLSITCTASKQPFAFARDKGVPFHEFFAYVSSSTNRPSAIAYHEY